MWSCDCVCGQDKKYGAGGGDTTLYTSYTALARQSCSVASVPTLLLSAASSEHRAEADRERLLTDACITETETLATHTSPHHSLASEMSRCTAILWRVSVASFVPKFPGEVPTDALSCSWWQRREGKTSNFQHECCWKCHSSWSSVVQAPAAAVGGVVPAAGDRTPTQQQQQQQQQQRLLPYCATTSTTPAAVRLHWLECGYSGSTHRVTSHTGMSRTAPGNQGQGAGTLRS